MIIKNECNCIVDEELLAKAIDKYCKRQNVYCNEVQRITIHNHYPTVVISRKHIKVHDLLRMLLYHTRKGYVVHHIDFNKLNDSVENLAYISHKSHNKIHSRQYWDYVKENGIRVNRENCGRKDISNDEIKQMLNNGMSVKEIAAHFNCHHNTIYQRISKWKT